MQNDRMRVAVLDDWQAVARQSADWGALQDRADLFFFEEPFADQEKLAKAVSEFDVIIAMRERTKFSKVLIDSLPRLRMIALTGGRTWTTDFDALNARGIPMCHTGGEKSGSATAEIALGLLLGAARFMNRGDAAIRSGKFQDDVPAGPVLDGKTLGILGLGKIGSRMARYGAALGMHVIAWSENLTEEKARAGGAQLVSKDALLTQSDAISLHVVLSDRTRGILGAGDLAKMKPGAILVNTSRGPLVDEKALIDRLKTGKLIAGLDVFDEEPLPADHPLRGMPNTMLTPHLGYGAREIYAQFYRESIENVLAFLDGKPMRVLNPESLKTR
ncbi:MAG TPA: D-2-hydroxyacid dehydrogenase family protein [Burkholderiales bacterium]|nr:D-2-hydroxyacid dehydrogenase family protein [Burkholderiales bacterium]